MEMPAAIKPYSIAVVPESSDRKLRKCRFKVAFHEKFAGSTERPCFYGRRLNGPQTEFLQIYCNSHQLGTAKSHALLAKTGD
jgi:hypothetical protein